MQYTELPLWSDLVDAEQHLTPEDYREFTALNPGDDLYYTLKENYTKSLHDPNVVMRVLLDDFGNVILIGGWHKLTGVAWFLTTTRAAEYPLLTLRAIKECREEALKDCPRLWNIVMKTNKQHVKLLEAIGATFEGPIWNIGGEPFQGFILDKEA